MALPCINPEAFSAFDEAKRTAQNGSFEVL
jgi:hypothetical protein